ncbi:helix-turn-helix domain-containing protein, partial [Staphylococcus agnetis]
MRKSKLTLEQYHQIFRLYEKGYSFQAIIEKLNLDIDKSVLSHAYNKYINHGVDSLLIRRTNHTYTAEFKKKVIEEHLVSGKSMSSIAAKYNIPS